MATILRPLHAEAPWAGVPTSEPRPGPRGQGRGGWALLIGCAIGLGLSWHTVLPDGVREELVAAVAAGPAAAPGATVGPNPIADQQMARPSRGMNELSERRQENELAVWPELTAELSDRPGDPSSENSTVAVLGRLALADESSATEPPPAASETPGEAMEVTFEVNSSYLPPGAEDQLRWFAGRVPEHQRGEVQIVATVSDDAVKGADAVEARRYNRWLAERRLARIKEFFQRSGDDLTVTQGFVEHDSSRRVMINLRSRA